MKNIKIAKIIFKWSFWFYIIYNFYFGWNEKPINHWEKDCDAIVGITFLIACCFYFNPAAKIYEEIVKEQEEYEKKDS